MCNFKLKSFRLAGVSSVVETGKGTCERQLTLLGTLVNHPSRITRKSKAVNTYRRK